MRTVDMQRHDAHAPHGPRGVSAGQKLDKDPVCGMTVPGGRAAAGDVPRRGVRLLQRALPRALREGAGTVRPQGRGSGASPLGAAPAAPSAGSARAPHHGPGRTGAGLDAAAGGCRCSGPARCIRRSCGMRPGQLPDLRHGARAAHRRRSRKRRTPSCVDMTRRFWVSAALTVPLVVARDGATCIPVAGLARARAAARRSLDRARARDAGRAVGRLAVLRARLAVGREPQPQHVHADRARRRRRVSSTASSRRSRPGLFPASFRGRRPARSASTSRRRPSIVDARAARPGARAARAQPDRRRDPRAARPRARRPRAASATTATEEDVPLDATSTSATACACGRARRCRSTASSLEGHEHGRRIDDHRRADPGREASRATASIGGTVNGTGALVDARRAGRRRHAARADRARWSAEAQRSRAPIQRLADRVAGVLRAGRDRDRRRDVRRLGARGARAAAGATRSSTRSPC